MNKKLVLGLAALLFSSIASAGTITAAVAEYPVELSAATAKATTQGDVKLTPSHSDSIFGRTGSFTVRLKLPADAKFNSIPELAVPAGWTARHIAGGQGSDQLVYSVISESSTPFPFDGTIVAKSFSISNTAALATVGSRLNVDLVLIDPNVGNELYKGSTAVFEAVQGVIVAVNTKAGDTNKRIDVGFNDQFKSRTVFSSTGAVGVLDSKDFDLGSLTVTIREDLGLSVAQHAPFVNIAVNGLDGVSSVFVSKDGCASSIDTLTLASGVYSGKVDTGSLSHNGNLYTGSICTAVNGTTQLAAQTPSALVNGTRADLLALATNGASRVVWTFNPAGESAAQSFIRISNPTDIPGQVELVGIDDNGRTGNGSIFVNIPARASRQFNSEDVEKGNAAKGMTGSFGDGVGKWRINLYSTLPAMTVSSLNRNLNDGTVTNLSGTSDK